MNQHGVSEEPIQDIALLMNSDWVYSQMNDSHIQIMTRERVNV